MKKNTNYYSPELRTIIIGPASTIAGSWNDGSLSGNPEEIYEETL